MSIQTILPKLRWKQLAQECAVFAHEEEFHSRRGAYPLDCGCDGTVLVVYNNSPYAAGKHFRQEELIRIRQRLDQLGLTELAFGTWPITGESRGYTYALLIAKWSKKVQDAVADVVCEETRRTCVTLFETV